MSMASLQGQSSVYKTQQTCPWRLYRDTPVSTKYNKRVHGVFTGTFQCLQNTTNMSMACLQGQSSVYKTQQTCPWCVYRDCAVSTKHNKHVHGVFTGTVQCQQNTTNMSTVCIKGQSSVYKTQQTCPRHIYRYSPVSTKHNKHVHGMFTGTVQCLQNTTNMSMASLQGQSSVYKTQQTCPWRVYRDSSVSTKHNKHVHGVFTGTVQCLQNTTNMSMACLQGQSSVYKTQQTCPWRVYRDSPVSTKHNKHVHGVFTGTVQCLQNTTKMSMACLQGQSIVYKTQQTCPWRVYWDNLQCLQNTTNMFMVFTGTVQCLQNTTNMSTVCIQGQSSVYRTQQTCPWHVYRDCPVSTKHNKHVHGVFTGTVQCLLNTTHMSTACLHGQTRVYKTQQTCPRRVYRDSPVSTKHNKHVHGVFAGTVQFLQKHNKHVHGMFTGTVHCLQNARNMFMACLQGQFSVYKKQQTCPLCVYRDCAMSAKHNKHVHGVFTGTAQCLQNTTNMTIVCLQGESIVYKTQQTCPWCVYRDSPMSTKHNKHVHGIFTGTAQYL